jgi:DNA-binding response OmpR family regulator
LGGNYTLPASPRKRGEGASLKIFQLQGYALDTVRGSLLTADREVEQRPKSFEALRCLVESAGRMVTRSSRRCG